VGRRVLIVDDNVDTAHRLARLLTRAGHEVMVAHNGSQAIDCAREQSPHAVVLDVGLPGMDGFEVVLRLREEPCCACPLSLPLPDTASRRIGSER